MLSRLRAFILHLAGNPALRPVDAALIWGIGQLVLTAGFALNLYEGIRRPEAAVYIDPDWVHRAFEVQATFPPFWIVFLLVVAGLRRRWPDSHIPAHVAMQGTVLVATWGAYITGLATFVFGVGSLVGIIAGGLLIFDVRVVRPAFATFLVGLAITTLAEQLGAIPYAPLFAAAPVQDGHLITRFLLTSSLPSILLAVFTTIILVASIERLRGTTALIRRYLPAQLAERILAGEHSGSAHPERRKLTLFFSDVVGFTEASDQMEPEDLSAHLNEYLSEMAAIADEYGATVNQFVGDGIMAFFGAPEATSDRDHALRAVRMSLAMQARMAELGRKWFSDGIQTPFRIRIGLNTGVASVGDFGSEGRTTYSAIGNQTNLTARIQDRCEPGKVLISHTTWALVKDEVPCEERGEIQVKGLHYPVRVYEVCS